MSQYDLRAQQAMARDYEQEVIAARAASQQSPLTDDEREAVISTLALLSRAHGESSAVRHYWFNLMRDQIARRSPEQIARMEQEKRLRGAV